MATIRKRGRRWQVQVRRNGRAASRTFDTKREAQQFAAGLEHDVLSGRYVMAIQSDTLSKAFERYFNEVSAPKKSHAQERPRIRQWQDSEFGTLRLDQITPQQLADWRDDQLKTQAPATVRLKLALLSHLYTVAAKEWGAPVENPVQRIRLPSTKGNARERRLRPGEYRRLLRAAPSVHPDLADFIRLAVLTGMRRSELTNLLWSNVHFDRRQAVLPDTKNGTQRVVPLSRRAVKVLQDRCDHVVLNERVFPLHPHRFTVAFSRACEQVGIRGLTLHDLRHEATSRFFERGLSLMEVASITGHKSLSMLKRYTHMDATQLAGKLG